MLSCSIIYLFLRIFALILLFTPTLGLFDTLHHGRLAGLAATTVRNYPNREPFGYTDDNSTITFYEAWQQFRIEEPSDFVDIPPLAVLAIILVMFTFHIIASSSILKLILKSKSPFLPNGFYTLICPPLHYDWEFLYTQSDEKDAILKCWKR